MRAPRRSWSRGGGRCLVWCSRPDLGSRAEGGGEADESKSAGSRSVLLEDFVVAQVGLGGAIEVRGVAGVAGQAGLVPDTPEGAEQVAVHGAGGVIGI